MYAPQGHFLRAPVVKIFACLELEQKYAFFKGLAISPSPKVIFLHKKKLNLNWGS
jgi:hypothetical protein